MRLVLPEVINVPAPDRPIRNPLRRCRDLQRRLVIPRIPRIPLQHLQRPLILRPHPVQRLRALHLFQIEMRIRIRIERIAGHFCILNWIARSQ